MVGRGCPPAPAGVRPPRPVPGVPPTTVTVVAPVRYRCAACGNLTRFDVTTTRRTRAFYHFAVDGALRVEDEELLAESVDEVTCRWCGHGRAVEALGPPAEGSGEAPAGVTAWSPPPVP